MTVGEGGRRGTKPLLLTYTERRKSGVGTQQHAFLIDLDGTLYAGGAPIPHAATFVAALRRRGLPFLFVTNNSSRTPEAVAAHLRGLGIEAEAEEVVTTSQCAARYIVRRGGGQRVYAIGEEGLRTALEEAGLQLVEEAPDFVVQGIDREFHYGKLELAVRFLSAGATYVLTNPDRLLPADGKLMPGAGAIAGSIREALQIEPIIIGKPHRPVIDYALERLGGVTANVWVVGDNPMTDIGAGKAAGLATALVLTGIATHDNVDKLLEGLEPNARPDLVCANLAELLERLGLDIAGSLE